MHFLNWALALLPLLASAEVELSHEAKMKELAEYDYNAHVFNDSYITHSVPTAAQMTAAYPDHDFHDNQDGTLRVVNRATNVTIHAQTIPWRLTGASLGVIGYHAYFGYDRIDTMFEICEAKGYTSKRCLNQALGAGSAHVLPALVGFVGGHAFVTRFWANAVDTGGGLYTGPSKRNALSSVAHLAARTTCDALKPFEDPHRFPGTYELKIAAKDACYTPGVGDLSEVQDLGYRAADLWRAADAYENQFTVFKLSSSVILGRYHVQMNDENTATCPIEITGGDSCVCTNCADELD